MKAYQKQFQRDISLFLKCRAEELVEGGRMVLTLLGRRSEDPAAKECCYIFQLLAMSLNEMVLEVHSQISLPFSYQEPISLSDIFLFAKMTLLFMFLF